MKSLLYNFCNLKLLIKVHTIQLWWWAIIIPSRETKILQCYPVLSGYIQFRRCPIKFSSKPLALFWEPRKWARFFKPKCRFKCNTQFKLHKDSSYNNTNHKHHWEELISIQFRQSQLQVEFQVRPSNFLFLYPTIIRILQITKRCLRLNNFKCLQMVLWRWLRRFNSSTN